MTALEEEEEEEEEVEGARLTSNLTGRARHMQTLQLGVGLLKILV